MLLQYFILFDYPQMSNLICGKSILKGKFNLNLLKTKSMIHVPPNFFFVRPRVAFLSNISDRYADRTATD